MGFMVRKLRIEADARFAAVADKVADLGGTLGKPLCGLPHG